MRRRAREVLRLLTTRGSLPVFTCRLCGCLTPTEARGQHDRWHRTTNR